MKLYEITAKVDGVIKTQYAGSLQYGIAARKTLSESGVKRADIKQEEVNVPTDKQGLLDFLNSR